MEIKLNTNIDFVARVSNTAPKGSRNISPEAAPSGFESSRSLESALSAAPDVRVDKLDEARRMAGDPEYPPRETIQRIAALLAMDNVESTEE